MLKTMVLSVPTWPVCTKANKNEPGIDGDSSIGSDRIDDKMVNLSSFTKKMSSGTGFFTFEARLAFTQLRKAFTKAPILHQFDPKSHIQIETNILGYGISEVLS